MNRRHFLCLAAPVAFMAAGVRSAAASLTSTPPPGTQPAPGTPGSAAGQPVELPIDPATPVVQLTSAGGFVPRGWDFAAPPQLLITAGGDVYRAVAMTQQFPGPLLLPIDHQTLTPTGLQRVLGMLRDAGMLNPPPSYDAEIMVTDTPSTVLAITTASGTVTHSANALGMASPDGGPEVSPARRTLLETVNRLTALDTVAGAELTRASAFAPTEYRIVAFPVNPADWAGSEPAPVVVRWPAATEVHLADAISCTRVPAAQVEELFSGATQLTFFSDGDVTYQVYARGVLPGDPQC